MNKMVISTTTNSNVHSANDTLNIETHHKSTFSVDLQLQNIETKF